MQIIVIKLLITIFIIFKNYSNCILWSNLLLQWNLDFPNLRYTNPLLSERYFVLIHVSERSFIRIFRDLAARSASSSNLSIKNDDKNKE